MKLLRADLHIHTVLSPCGDLSMSPVNIISEARRKKLDIIGITDHNTTRHCKLLKKMGEEAGIFTLMGSEVTTAEEVHCLVFFEDIETVDLFQNLLDKSLPDIKNVPELFGDQVQVNENEEIIYTEDKMLLNAVKISINELEKQVHLMNGIFIPAHIDRRKNSIYSQLGIMPENLIADAFEISYRSNPETFLKEHPETISYTLITGSDAHYPEQIGNHGFTAQINEASYNEILLALHGIGERRIILK